MLNRWLMRLYRLVGLALLLAGVGLAALVPLETQCYAWFAPGGRFYYAGYGYGALMFANITLQIVAYALLAALLIPLGLGHLRQRAWSATLMQAGLLAWLALGLPLAVAALALLYAQKELSLAAGLAYLALAVLTYPAAPLVLLRLYRSPRVAALLGVAGAHRRDQQQTARVAALSLILIGGATAMAVPVFFRGLFPLLLRWANGPPALGLNLLAVLGLIALAVAWWRAPQHFWRLTLAAIAGLGLLWALTLAHTPWRELVGLLRLPPLEQQLMSGLPLHGAYLAGLIALPCAVAIGLILRWQHTEKAGPG